MVVVTTKNSHEPDQQTFNKEIRTGRLRIRYMMPSTHLNLREDDVVRLALEFLHNRDLHITQLSLERETGVINGSYADDVLFLRQLILDGQWDDVLEFIQPLGALKTFEIDKFNYAILRHKYIELLCIKSEIKAYNNVDNIVDEVVKVLNELEKLAPSKDEYSNLCLLLTLQSITDHAQFKKWNPSNARVQCFREVYPLVEQFLPCDKKSSGTPISKTSKNDRLMQLLIKGILYESCVNYCQAKATGSKEAQSSEVTFSSLLEGSGFDESDLSLLSWLHSIPGETFSVPFEQRTLNVDVERLERPSLHTSWTEHMLVTPIKPRTFPHLAMPFRRPRSAADAMTRSLRPLPDGAPRHPAVMALSAIDYVPSSSCFAGFHLTGIKGSKIMNTSVDMLFEKDADGSLNGGNDFRKQLESSPLAKVLELSPATEKAPTLSNVSTPEHRGRDSPASVSASTAASTARSSLSERAPSVPLRQPTPPPPPNAQSGQPQEDFRRELLKEYQIQKQRECDDYIRQLCPTDSRQQKKSAMEAGSSSSGAGRTNAPTSDVLNEGACALPREKSPRLETSGHSEDYYDINNNKMTTVNQAVAMRQLDLMFDNLNVDGRRASYQPTVHFSVEPDARCDVHGRNSPHRSLYLYGREASPGFRKESATAINMPVRGLSLGRRDSLGIPASPPAKELEHPSAFPSFLRRDPLSTSSASLRRDTPSPTPRLSPNRHSMGSFSNLRRNSVNCVNYNRRDSISNSTIRDMKRDYVGSTGSLSRKDIRQSMDSLDSGRRDSWDPNRRGSTTSDLEEIMQEERFTNKHKQQARGAMARQNAASPNAAAADASDANASGVNRPTFRPVTVLGDLQAVRCAEFHPSGAYYAIGSNTKTLRICAYPSVDEMTAVSTSLEDARPPVVNFKRTKHHKGSIYCLGWSPAGDLLATGSNDKTVKLMRFNSKKCSLDGQEVELLMHDGTVRDLCFIEDTTNRASLLVTGGAGDCKIYITDCATGKPFQALSGHSGHILSLYNWGGALFVSGSQDKTVRFWDLRTGTCVNVIAPSNIPSYRGSPVTSVAVEPSGRLLVSGHEDSSCALYDVRGNRSLQRFTPHTADVRSVRFSPGAYYLLTASYDGRIMLTDLQGDLTCALPSVLVARHPDKVISARWHPEDFSFLSTSADKTATLWTIPPM